MTMVDSSIFASLIFWLSEFDVNLNEKECFTND